MDDGISISTMMPRMKTFQIRRNGFKWKAEIHLMDAVDVSITLWLMLQNIIINSCNLFFALNKVWISILDSIDTQTYIHTLQKINPSIDFRWYQITVNRWNVFGARCSFISKWIFQQLSTLVGYVLLTVELCMN